MVIRRLAAWARSAWLRGLFLGLVAGGDVGGNHHLGQAAIHPG